MAGKTPGQPDRPAAFQPRLSAARPVWRTEQNEHDSSIGSPPGSLTKIQRWAARSKPTRAEFTLAGFSAVRGIPASLRLGAAKRVHTSERRSPRERLLGR